MSTIDFAFLDSGTGGIPYMLHLKKLNPAVRCVYLGDTANFPYGQKTFSQITECASNAIDLIIKKWNPRCVVVACNTISVTALSELRRKFPELPIVGTVPAIKLAAKLSSNKKIGLLATNASVNHPYSKKLIEDFASDCIVFSKGDPDLISFIEHDLFTATKEERINAVKPSVDWFKSKDCDTIILGCTHFTNSASDIQEYSGPGIKVVDSRQGVASHALDILKTAPEKRTAEENLCPDQTFFVTGYKNTKDKEEYETLCNRYSIPFGGIIKETL